MKVEGVKIGDCCDKKVETLRSYKGLIDYIDISSIDNIQKSITAFQTIDSELAPSRAKQLVKKNDVLVSTVRPNLNAVALIDIESDNILVASTGYCVLRCNQRLNCRYLYYFCQSARFIDCLVKQATGASYPAVNSSIVRNCIIPLPSIEDQQRIAMLLDKLSTLISLRKQQLEKLDELVKARFVEMFGDENNVIELSNLCSIITDGTHQPPRFVEQGIPFLFVSNVVDNKLTYNTNKFIDQRTYDELIKRTPIEIGDILLSTVGSYGHPAVVKSEKRFLFQRHIAYLKPKKEQIDSDYLHCAFLSSDVQNQIERRVKGIAQKTLNLSEIKQIRIPVPSMEKQREFTVYTSKIDRIAAPINESIKKMETLKNALMQEYFA